MRKILLIALIIIVAAALVATISAKTSRAPKDDCVAIQSGTIIDAYDGSVITTGVNSWGYNYQGHIFNGTYCDAYHNAIWCQKWKDVKLIIKWNDNWTSNQDCNGDGKLDKNTGVGSDAWATNHQSGEYIKNGETCAWDYFVKIAAKPTADYNCEANGGEQIWTNFCIIQKVLNDPCAGYEGLDFKTHNPGLGVWQNQ